ncbi:hypothetical protein SETIT_3G211000v2 [Setaria italica]|uniref:DUF1618 domain-containing protein n=1 Tax=Setaria italica TaxID=4555 RepID=K3Z673_SETIT|nr:uncharacterized protein LOC101761996 [Setaria italica]RCV17323.1 hypothetical protein SETIT_3G211000v2 [Setaria italica]
MEVQSNRLFSIPDWVVLDHQIFPKDLDSFRNNVVTSAEVCASNSELVRVSFILSALPGTSRLCVHLKEGHELSCLDTVVAAHGKAVLFRLKVDFEGLTGKAIDYFIYWAYTSGPKLSLVPRYYSTVKEIAAAEEGSWRRRLRYRMANYRGIGLLLTGDSEEFVVAELRLNLSKLEDDVDAPLEGELFRLRSDGAGAAGEWEVKNTSVRDGKPTFRDIHGWWEAHKVVPYARYLCWVDYYRGVIFCDVNNDNPELQYLALPVGYVLPGYPVPFRSVLPQVFRAVCITKDETMKFINVVHDDSFPMVSAGSSFTIVISTLVHDYDEMRWQEDLKIESHELWEMEGYDDQLPRIAPLFPLMSVDNPNIIYFVLRERKTLDAGAKTCVVTLDMVNKKVLSYKDIKAIPEEDPVMASYNIFLNVPFFPSEFSKHLQKAAPMKKKESQEVIGC